MKTLLIDLDDTLLTNPTETFLPAYFDALAEELKDYAAPETILHLLASDKYGMMSSQDPAITLADNFIPKFYKDLKVDYKNVREQIEHFFEEKYNDLQPLTQQRPEAITLIDQAIEQGWQIAIATNPVFPQTATQNRLAWAGFPKEKYSFLAVSSFEDYHFAKPNPAYYAEVLAQIGWPEGPIVMVGNDEIMDIQGAQDLGLATFWITDQTPKNQSANGTKNPPAHAGQLDQVLPWLASLSEEDLTPAYNTSKTLIAILRSTAAAIHTLTRNIASQQWDRNPAPNEWNLTQIICHLKDIDKDINIPRLDLLKKEENPFIASIDTDAWAEEREYHLENGPDSFRQFIDTRKQFIQILEDLDPEDWNTPARHTIFGPTTLKELIKIITQHDRKHIQQIHAILNQVQV